MNSPSGGGFEPFEELIAQLRADGRVEAAQRVEMLVRGRAWTTSSEFLGEVGKELAAIRRDQPHTAALAKALDRCGAIVRRAWPGWL